MPALSLQAAADYIVTTLFMLCSSPGHRTNLMVSLMHRIYELHWRHAKSMLYACVNVSRVHDIGSCRECLF